MARVGTVRSLFRCSLAASVALLLVTSTPASAQLSESALKCRQVVANNLRKLISVAVKVNAKCHKQRDGGEAISCNQPAASSTFVAAVRRAEPAIISACESEASALITEYYHSCATSGCHAVSEPMQTVEDLAYCVSCMGTHLGEELGVEVLGAPDVTMLSADDVTCRAAISGYGKFVKTALGIENKCQRDQDRAGNYDTASCVDFDPKGKAEKDQTKASDKLLEACATATISNLDSCASDTAANLKTCVETQFSQLADFLFLSGYEMPAP